MVKSILGTILDKKGSIKTSYVTVKDKQFYTVDNLLKVNADINYINSTRNIGKSYDIKHLLIDSALTQEDSLFFFVRHLPTEITEEAILEYYGDLDFNNPKYPSLHEYDCIRVSLRGKLIMICKTDEDGNIEKSVTVGKAIPLQKAISFKSRAFPNYNYMLFEEYSRTDLTWKNEMQLFMSLVSTFTRYKENFKVFCVGNLTDRNSCHYQHFQLTGALNQKPGTIDTYKSYSNPPIFDKDGNQKYTLIAVDFADNRNEPNSLLLGSKAQKMTSNNEYESEEQTLIESNNNQTVHTIIFEQGYLRFKADLKIDSNQFPYWEVCYKTSEVKKNTRVITDRFSTNPLHTNEIKGVSHKENEMLKLLLHGKVAFATNLCGTEFKKMIERW